MWIFHTWSIWERCDPPTIQHMSLVVTIVMYIYVPAWSLTARPWKYLPKRKVISLPTIRFRGYVKLRECTPFFTWKKTPIHSFKKLENNAAQQMPKLRNPPEEPPYPRFGWSCLRRTNTSDLTVLQDQKSLDKMAENESGNIYRICW